MTHSETKTEAGTIRPEWYYLCVAIPFGFVFVFLTPPSNAPDEFAHLLRSYQLSEFRVASTKKDNLTGDELPNSLTTMMAPYWNVPFHRDVKVTRADLQKSAEIPLNPDHRGFVAFSNTAVHPPLTYLPQATGILLARQVTSSVLTMFYVGRAFNLLATTALMFIAIRHVPVGKWMFATLGLAPMMLFLSGSLSSDSVTDGLAFLLLSHVLYLAYGPEERVSMPRLLELGLLSIAIGQCKQGYFLLPASYLLIPKSRFARPKQYWGGFLLVMGLTLWSIVSWGLTMRDFYTPANPSTEINPKLQLQMMIEDPAQFLAAMSATSRNSLALLRQFTGVLGFLDTDIPWWAMIAEWAVMLVAFANMAPRGTVTFRQAFDALALCIAILLVICVIIYLTWESVGWDGPISIQGRYFIPCGPLVGLTLSRFLMALPDRLIRKLPLLQHLSILIIPSLLLVTCFSAYERYYVVSGDEAAHQATVAVAESAPE